MKPQADRFSGWRSQKELMTERRELYWHVSSCSVRDDRTLKMFFKKGGGGGVGGNRPRNMKRVLDDQKRRSFESLSKTFFFSFLLHLLCKSISSGDENIGPAPAHWPRPPPGRLLRLLLLLLDASPWQQSRPPDRPAGRPPDDGRERLTHRAQ